MNHIAQVDESHCWNPHVESGLQQDMPRHNAWTLEFTSAQFTCEMLLIISHKWMSHVSQMDESCLADVDGSCLTDR